MAQSKISGETAVPESQERRLWRAVLFGALHDALGIVTGISNDRGKGTNAKRHCVVRALAWFEGGGYNGLELPLVCSLAGVEQSRFRTSAMHAIHFRWGESPKQAAAVAPSNQICRSYLLKVSREAHYRCPVVRAILETTRHEGT